jgi:hypothetical protein
MSRIVTISGTEITKPELLDSAISQIQTLAKLKLIASINRDKDGIPISGTISIPSDITHEDMLKQKAEMDPAEVTLLETKFPGYFGKGMTYVEAEVRFSTKNGVVTLSCDEDYPENFSLAQMIQDHYLSAVVKQAMIEDGYCVEISLGEEGINVDITEIEQPVISNY